MNWTNREIARIAKSAKHRRKVSVRTRDEQGVHSFSIWILWQFRRFWQCLDRVAIRPDKINRKARKKQAQTKKTVARSGPDLVAGEKRILAG